MIEHLAGLASQIAPTGADSTSAALLGDFVRRYYADASLEDLSTRSPETLRTAALTHAHLGARRTPGTTLVQVSNPTAVTNGSTPPTIIDIVTDDMPFLVDSVNLEIERHGLDCRPVVHPVIGVVRDSDGTLLSLAAEAGADPEAAFDRQRGDLKEAYLHFEVERIVGDDRLKQLQASIERVLDDVRAGTRDWVKMLAALRRVMDDTRRHPPPIDAEILSESIALLQWMASRNFLFLGSRDYEIRPRTDGDPDRTDSDSSAAGDTSYVLAPIAGTGLGLLRDSRPGELAPTITTLTVEQRNRFADGTLLVITKTNARSTVHRDTHFDYVGVKRFDAAGNVVGEHRILGLFTSTAYHSTPIDIPLLRHKVASVVTRSGFRLSSHDSKEIITVLEAYPRDELFQMGVDELLNVATEIVALQHRRRVRLFVRRDPFHRFVTCIVYLPRDRYTTEVRLRITEILRETFEATDHEYQASVTESPLARLFFVLATSSTKPVDVAALERRVASATRQWDDRVGDELADMHGDEDGWLLARRYAHAFPVSYQETHDTLRAVEDIRALEELPELPRLGLRLDQTDGVVTLTMYGKCAPRPLSQVMPLIQSMGVSVVEEHPYIITVENEEPGWIAEFILRLPEHAATALLSEVRRITFCDTLDAILRGAAEIDAFNALIIEAGLAWREVVVIRAYARYLRLIGSHFSEQYVAQCLVKHPSITRSVVDLFLERFDPMHRSDIAERERNSAVLAHAIGVELDGVAVLDEDRILRTFLRLVLATTRTTYFTATNESPLAFKIDPRQIPDLPEPRPMFECFVYSPRVEGVHLRMGRVARGGIRSSDRREDFRTEVLGLMKAQAVKNAVIVPVGAKGGFVAKSLPAAPDAAKTEVIACYEAFISSMLDLADNLVDGVVVSPPGVVRFDGDDTYFVVAADKGTATFSDLANEISIAHNYWLGDAFASGGSAGYDHKEMGITAKGAWVSAVHNFRRLGINPDHDRFTVVGIGDMSGDVFGNGMQQSRNLRLVAAFDHRHIFLDPNPDPQPAFAERARLFALPKSSWADYDSDLISDGGGVFARTDKSIPLSPEVRARLDISAEALAPNELIAVILRAPVDMIWNGGIGTYVKASHERHEDVGDKTNDAVRVNADDLRARSVVEGGNLGLTQLARIEFALDGGLVHTDAIDNAAGVNCSDHEVNIKILLDSLVRRKRLEHDARNSLLEEMTDEVEQSVLRDNHEQVRALSNEYALAHSMEDANARYMHSLEQSGRLDRALEFLPDDATLAARHGAGVAFTIPDLAVLMAYAKLEATNALLDSDVPDDPDFVGQLLNRFPTPLRSPYRVDIIEHPLRREIVANMLANRIVNEAGVSFLFRMVDEIGASADDIARAHVVARTVFDLDALWAQIAALDDRVASTLQTQMYLEGRTLVERGVRWLCNARPRPLRVAATIDEFAEGIRALTSVLPTMLRGEERALFEAHTERLVAGQVPTDLARAVALQDSMCAAFDIVDLATTTGRTVEEVTALATAVGDRLSIIWLRERVLEDLPRSTRWQTLARSALRDDIFREHRGVTAAVLASSAAGTDPDTAIDTWSAANRAGVDRMLGIIADIRRLGTIDLASLSVALRELRTLAE